MPFINVYSAECSKVSQDIVNLSLNIGYRILLIIISKSHYGDIKIFLAPMADHCHQCHAMAVF